jgi:hypothetical protein
MIDAVLMLISLDSSCFVESEVCVCGVKTLEQRFALRRICKTLLAIRAELLNFNGLLVTSSQLVEVQNHNTRHIEAEQSHKRFFFTVPPAGETQQ